MLLIIDRNQLHTYTTAEISQRWLFVWLYCWEKNVKVMRPPNWWQGTIDRDPYLLSKHECNSVNSSRLHIIHRKKFDFLNGIASIWHHIWIFINNTAWKKVSYAYLYINFNRARKMELHILKDHNFTLVFTNVTKQRNTS